MAKEKQYFSCSHCGASFSKWIGRCSDCGEWNSITETAPPVPSAANRFSGYTGMPADIHTIGDVKIENSIRLSTGFAEFDRVLGGGLVQGTVVLIGGDPGVGKSTALLQVCFKLSGSTKTLYVTGEESLQQIALRAKRLGVSDGKLLLMAETQIESICAAVTKEQPKVVVIDSIQTMQIAEIQSAPGSVTQVRESASFLTRFAKQTNTTILLVGHVTKSGDIAGPRVLEHIIDVVCYIEGSRDSRYRIMRAVKNRHGAVNELGVFAMTDTGMKEIKNPSAIFLSQSRHTMSGSVVMVIWEGSRPLLVEIQALVDESYAENPRRVSIGLEQNRLSMLLAVLHRHGNVATYKKDIFINVVGGVRVMETSADLALILAIHSSLADRPLPEDLVVFGEIGLAGELRPVPNGQERLREAAKHGFKKAIVPKANVPQKNNIKGLEITGVTRLREALDAF